MNNGAFGEGFPYTNFHDLNMDWIVKIAKDFLDQYSHIQETITEGLEGLDSKAQELEELLQQWYDTHSEDIANELANALASIGTTFEDGMREFDVHADEKTAKSIASIPGTYNALNSEVSFLSAMASQANLFTGEHFTGILNDNPGETFGTTISVNNNYSYTPLIPITNTDVLFAWVRISNPNQYLYVHYYDSENKKISGYNGMGAIIDKNIPSNAVNVSVVYWQGFADTLVIKKNEAPYYNAKAGDIKKFLRLDQGRIAGWKPGATGSTSAPLFPFVNDANIMVTFPVIVPENRNVYFYSNGKYFSHNYYDFNGDYISTEDSGNTSRQLTIPASAKYILGYSSISTTANDYCYLNVDHAPAYLPEFGEVYPDTNIKNKQLVMFGDSITSGYYYGGGWPTILKDVYGAYYANNQGHDGWEVSRNPNEQNCLIDLIDTVDPTGYDIVILSGGINDCSRHVNIGSLPEFTYYTNSNETDFAPAVFNYVKKARQHFPNAKLFYVLTPYKEWTNSNTSRIQRNAWNVIRKACAMFGVEVIDLSMNGGLVGVQVQNVTDTITQLYYRNADGTHPNYNGYKYLVPFIANSISDQLI